jgi:hypothetical protein
VLDTSKAPYAVQDLWAWLCSQDFEQVSGQTTGQNNQFVELVSGQRLITISVDRGDWSIAIGASWMNDTYHPDEWAAWIGGFDLAGELSDLENQAAFVKDRWAAAIEAAARKRSAEDEIRRIGLDYVRRRFGEDSVPDGHG